MKNWDSWPPSKFLTMFIQPVFNKSCQSHNTFFWEYEVPYKFTIAEGVKIVLIIACVSPTHPPIKCPNFPLIEEFFHFIMILLLNIGAWLKAELINSQYFSFPAAWVGISTEAKHGSLRTFWLAVTCSYLSLPVLLFWITLQLRTDNAKLREFTLDVFGYQIDKYR